jgi:hypothetical protein
MKLIVGSAVVENGAKKSVELILHYGVNKIFL